MTTASTEIADKLAGIRTALEPFAFAAVLSQGDDFFVIGSYPVIITNDHCKAAARALDTIDALAREQVSQ